VIVNVIDTHPADPSFNQPPGTISESAEFWSSRRVLLAITHRYVNPGTSYATKYDPKRLEIDGEVYRAAHDDRHPCPDCQKWRPSR
jgi:hypothetical protein